jgi:hypothetical protein
MKALILLLFAMLFAMPFSIHSHHLVVTNSSVRVPAARATRWWMDRHR